MADLANPYANPYLPSFVNQRPRTTDIKPPVQVPQLNLGTPNYTQIKSVSGFDGARAFVINSLAAGSSDIIAESDPNIPRIYIVAKDSTGQIFVEGYRLTHEEEPKPITMDDLNAKMSELLDRMNRLEEERNRGSNAKSGGESSWKDRPANQNAARTQSNGGRVLQSPDSPTVDSK